MGGTMLRQESIKASLLTLLFCLAAAAVCSAQDAPRPGPDEPVAVVAGQPIYDQDLISAAGQSLLDLRKQEYKLKSDVLNQAIRKKLVEVEAKKKGLSTDELLKKEVDSKIADPSDDEAKGYYLALKNETSLPFEQVKSQAKQLLKKAEIEQARTQYADSLRDSAEISILLHPPLVQVSYDPARVKGNADALVAITEFADFQCPFCSRIESALHEVLAKYEGKVKLSYRDFPLSQIHPNAKIAAEASHCALEQGKYWQMHDAMFADQSKLDEAALVKTAAGLSMDQNSFESCLKSGRYEAVVDQDFQAGSEAGVNATPTFYINGEFLSGVQSEADFAQIIDRQLAVLSRRASTQASTASQLMK
jgi:protein-disulfide isomerase